MEIWNRGKGSRKEKGVEEMDDDDDDNEGGERRKTK